MATPQSETLVLNDPLGVVVHHGDAFQILDAMLEGFPDGRYDMIFADPPYFLSNGGITCSNGKMVPVNKGQWDKSQGAERNHEFNKSWLRKCQRLLRPNGTIWISGTHHVIFSVGFAMQELGYKILNQITWEKPNPPPNLSCRYFTHSTESIIWAGKNKDTKHVFNYQPMKQANNGKQMKTVWRWETDLWKQAAPLKAEKAHGKHPTQKPIALIERCILASTSPENSVLDPFMGSGTTGVACARTGRAFTGIELDRAHMEVAVRRIKAELTALPAKTTKYEVRPNHRA